MPIPPLSSFCINNPVTPGEICIPMPGGSQVCATLPDLVPPAPDKFVRQLFGQVNAALAPLEPVFNIIDAVVATFECIKATSTLNPQKIIECIPNLAEKVGALLQLIPQLSLVGTVAALIEVIILFLQSQQTQIRRMKDLLTRLLDAETAATRPGNLALADILPCAFDDLDKLVVWQNESNKPVNRLIGVINLFLEIIGLEDYQIPCIGSLASDLDLIDKQLELIDALIELLTIIRTAIPFPSFGYVNAQPGGVASGC